MTLKGTLKKIGYFALFLILISLFPLFISAIHNLYNRYLDPRAHVAVLPIKGVLCDSSYYTKQLHKYFKDDQIKAILLRIESPGSTTGTGNAIYNELITLKKEYPKPVIVLVENICASGGYYIACGGDHIIASPMAIIGSIGVAAPYLVQLKDFIEQFKIKFVPLAAGDYKNSTNPLTDLTPEQQKMLQEMLDDSYAIFTNDVAKSRNLSLDQADQWANGKVFTGRQALQLKLIDQLGSSSQAVEAIKEKAGITTDIKWIKPPSRGGILSLFMDSSDQDESFFASCINEFCAVLESRYFQAKLQ